MDKKLMRSYNNKMIAGICGGIAEYYDADPSIVRLIAVALLLVTNFPMVGVYILAAIIIPMAPKDSCSKEDTHSNTN